MKVGDIVEVWITEATINGFTGKKKKAKGVVEYIHPKRRFFRVRFQFGRGRSYAESFLM